MRILIYTLFVAMLGWLTVGCQSASQPKGRQGLVSGFATPPDSIKTAAYWYWLSNNVSKEGVVKDLQSMKKAGINRAYIRNIDLNDLPHGNTPMLGDAWWEVLHTALKSATELDIEIGIFSSPSWSQSGDPWIQSTEAMRYLAASHLCVQGPAKLVQKLEQPTENFQDVRVIAYPAPRGYQQKFTPATGHVISGGAPGGMALLDGNMTTVMQLPHEGEVVITLNASEPFTARSLTLWPTATPIVAKCRLDALDGGIYQPLSSFQIYRTRTELNVGFIPDAPVVISFPATTSASFRLTLESEQQGAVLAELDLSPEARVASYSEKSLAKMYPEPLPYWREYQWPRQAELDDPSWAVSPLQVIDISQYMAADGTLSWSVPPGSWIIMRTGMAPTGTTHGLALPEAMGYEADKMSRQHTQKHFEGYIGEILKRIPAEDRKSFKVVAQDSYEAGSQNFTDSFLEDFQARYGYDPLPYLPVFYGCVVGSLDTSDRFLWDMRRMVADRVAYDYVAGLRDVSHQHGLTTWLENYGHRGYPGEFLLHGGQSDEIGGEFWAEGNLGNIENRDAASCGHIYGKPRIWAESFTSSGKFFARHPATLKARGDRFFSEGINSTLLHAYISQPYDSLPGLNAWFGVEFNRNNTWFSQIDLFTDYLKRTNFMLQQGLNVADVAYFIGEDAPKMAGITDPPLPLGYEFDYINAEVIEKYMTLQSGHLTLAHGTQYRLMVLPQMETMRPELLEKIRQLVYQGAVILGPAPQRSPSLENQPRADSLVRTMATKMWGNADGVHVKHHKYGQGMVLCGLSMEEALAQINCIADCALPEGRPFMYGHRTLGDQEIYYLTNQSDQPQQVTPRFRVSGKQPELWLPTTGAMRDLPAFTQEGQTTSVPLQLAPYESYFIVFSKPAPKKPKGAAVELNFPIPKVLAEVSGPWEVQFDPALRGPQNKVVMERLQPWNLSADKTIRFYSGTAHYTVHVTLPKWSSQEGVMIDLGRVDVMAKVTVNDTYVGGVWTPPYVLDITSAVHAGGNTIRIEVVNTWVNRLIGDSILPDPERKTWTVYNNYKPESPLQSSGLIGPVTIGLLPKP